MVCQAFLENPNDYEQVDHINNDKTDNRVENLRYCNNSMNCKNKNSVNGDLFEFIEEMPIDAVEIEFYSKH